MGYRLKKDNIEKVFEDEAFKSELLDNGWEEIEETSIDLKAMTIEQLKSIANERNFQYDSKIKKDDLIKLLKDTE